MDQETPQPRVSHENHRHRVDPEQQREAVADIPVNTIPGLLPTPENRESFSLPEPADRILLTIPAGKRGRLKAFVFRVMAVERQHAHMPTPITQGTTLRARVDERAPSGKRWDLRGIQVGSTAFWGTAALEVVGRTGKTLRLRLRDIYDRDEIVFDDTDTQEEEA